MKCPNCGTVNAPGEEFCRNCGASLDPTATDATIATSINPVGTGSSGATTLTGSGGTGSSRTLVPGARLENGRYLIEKVLGQGGMGAALLAKDTRVSNKLVVIKELISDNTDPEKRKEDVRNFAREVETLSKLDHPLIPNVTDSFQEGTHYFMVQEYVPGENLEDRMERVKQPMPEQEALTYASQILDILDYLEHFEYDDENGNHHKTPIVHRDIKPANIIISSRNKRAYLVDFGIARADVAKSAKRRQTSALGTPGYAPPEQYQGNADPRSDLYALAATLHHVLTNRDPRNYPPFAYPPARSLNPKLSPEIERVLNRALMIDITKRYQNAAAMKQDIDDILMQRFGVGSTTSTYTFGGSGPIGTTGAQSTISGPPRSPNTPIPPSSPQRIQPRPIQQPAQNRPQQSPSQARPAVSPPPYPLPPQQPIYPGPPAQQRRRGGIGWVAGSCLLLVVVALIAAALFIVPSLLRKGSTGTNPGITPTVSGSANGIGITQIGGEPIGISDGSIAIDTKRTDGTLKEQAAASLEQGNIGGAIAQWNAAVAQETNDAEALIYLENQRIARSPHVTYVVATMLSGDQATIGIGREDLQGAYVAQKEFNDTSRLPNGVKVRLLIANAGSKQANVTQVAQQIVQLAKADKTVVGVMGWPFSSYAFNAVQVLDGAHIPMVSQTASSDQLTGISPYFFRVAPTNKAQGIDGAVYAKQTLHAKNVALFVDNADLYSQSLGQAFSQQFTADGGTIVATESYTRGKPETLTGTLQDALSKQPDLIYFSGYASDLSTLLPELLSAGAPASLQVLGGDALYELSGYPENVRPALSRLHFTTFFYPDVWDIQGLKNSPKKPPFFADYPNYFDPNRQHQNNPYGYIRPTNHNALAYDAMLTLLKAYSLAVASGKTTVTPQDIQQGLTQINGANSLQGASGKISFDANGNAVNKAVVILYFDATGHIQMDPRVLGAFL
jgi:eukaryotic-like serine/threonine-protein kinase